jgi:hypothetical protein
MLVDRLWGPHQEDNQILRSSSDSFTMLAVMARLLIAKN